MGTATSCLRAQPEADGLQAKPAVRATRAVDAAAEDVPVKNVLDEPPAPQPAPLPEEPAPVSRLPAPVTSPFQTVAKRASGAQLLLRSRPCTLPG